MLVKSTVSEFCGAQVLISSHKQVQLKRGKRPKICRWQLLPVGEAKFCSVYSSDLFNTSLVQCGHAAENKQREKQHANFQDSIGSGASCNALRSTCRKCVRCASRLWTRRAKSCCAHKARRGRQTKATCNESSSGGAGARTQLRSKATLLSVEFTHRVEVNPESHGDRGEFGVCDSVMTFVPGYTYLLRYAVGMFASQTTAE